MQSGRPQPRAPGSFSPLPSSVSSSAAAAAAAASGGRDRRPSSSSSSQQFPQAQTNARPQIRRIDTSSSDDTAATSQQYFALPRVRSPQTPVNVTSPSFPGFTAHSNGSSASLQSPQNFSRPGRPSNETTPSVRNASPLTLPPNRVPGGGHHSRKHSQSQGLFDTTLPSTSTSNLAQMAMPPPPASAGALTASQIAAQAAMQHQNQSHQQHSRHRSQTVPFPGGGEGYESANQRQQGSKSGGPTPNPGGPLSPPVLSLTEASVPRDGALGDQHRYHNGLLGTQAATTAANVVFPRTSPQSSPSLPTDELRQSAMPLPLQMPEKPAKAEKPKVKLFSRPKKIETKGEASQKPLPSPSKIGSALASLQRGNYSTTSLAESQSLYTLNNSSSATIRPGDAANEKDGKEKEKEKEKKHHFLSRQKHKLSNKDDYHLPLSSAASNSRPVDPSAPSSLYNFNLPPSPGPNSSSFGKSVSGLDLRHGGRALREKRKEEKLGMAHENESVYTINNSTADWPGPSSLGSTLTQTQSNLSFLESIDGSKHGLNSLSLDDAWPYLKAKLLVIFEGEDLRLPIEDFNRVVNMHLQFCIQRRSSHIIIEDVRELLSTGFLSLDHTLRKTPEDRLIPALAELWIFTFTSVLPYMQAVFLPLDLEFSGNGSLLTPEQAREFWGSLVASSPAPRATESEAPPSTPASQVLDVRHLVLLAYRDTLILPRYDKLKGIFSRLSLEHLPASLASLALASPPATDPSVLSTSLPREIETGFRPGTAMSLDPSVASYNSSSSTLLNEGSNPSRSRAISNVSFGSHGSEGTPGSYLRPFTPALTANGRERNGSGSGSSLRDRDQNVEFGSKQVTDMVGRMLQCMSVLASVSANNALDPAASAAGTPTGGAGDEGNRMVSELGRLLKLNWLGRGRTGRNRRGMVPGRVVRGEESRAGRSNSHTGLGIGMAQGITEEVEAMG